LQWSKTSLQLGCQRIHPIQWETSLFPPFLCWKISVTTIPRSKRGWNPRC
jgi:hypothetical protein